MKLERDEKISALKEKEMQSETIEDVEKQLKGEGSTKGAGASEGDGLYLCQHRRRHQ